MKKKLVAAILAGSMVFQSSGVLCVRAESLQDQTPETQMETEEESELQTGTADALRQTGKETAKKLEELLIMLRDEGEDKTFEYIKNVLLKQNDY